MIVHLTLLTSTTIPLTLVCDKKTKAISNHEQYGKKLKIDRDLKYNKKCCI